MDVGVCQGAALSNLEEGVGHEPASDTDKVTHSDLGAYVRPLRWFAIGIHVGMRGKSQIFHGFRYSRGGFGVPGFKFSF